MCNGLLTLSLDVLYSYVFPQLEYRDLINLYIALEYIRPAIHSYKHWDTHYKAVFSADAVVPPQSGFERFASRCYASVYCWGIISHMRDSELDTPTTSYEGGLGFIRVPVKADLRGLHVIKKYAASHAVLQLDGHVYRYLGSWRPDPRWPELIKKLRCHEAEITGTGNSNTIIYVGFSNVVLRLRLSHPNHEIIDAAFYWNKTFLLVRDLGLIVFDSVYELPGSHDSESPYKVLVSGCDFPMPCKQVCFFSEAYSFALLSATRGTVYELRVDNASLANEWIKYSFAVPIKQIARLEYRYKTIQEDGKWIFCSLPPGGVHKTGVLGLGIDRNVYYFDFALSNVTQIPGLQDIVKVSSKGGAFVCLDKYGQVYFAGDTSVPFHGLGDNIEYDMVEDDESLKIKTSDLYGSPTSDLMTIDYRRALERPCLLKLTTSEQRRSPYIVYPRKLPFKEFVVDVNICGSECSAVVVTPACLPK